MQVQDNWKSQYENNNPPVNWSDTLATIGTKSASQGGVYDYPYGKTPEKLTEADKMNNYANSVEKALYLTEQKYKAISSKYHCYAMSIGTATEYQWGPVIHELSGKWKQGGFQSDRERYRIPGR